MATLVDPSLPNAFPVGLNAAALRKLGQNDSFQVHSLEAWLALIALNLPSGVEHGANVLITLSLDTSIYAAGDVLADTQPIVGAVRSSGSSALLTSLSLIDKDDNTAAGIDLVFLRSNVSLGTENAAPSITDTNAAEVIGIVSLVAGDFIDLGGSKVASKTNIGLRLTPTTGTSVYVAAITRGTPTQTASGIVINFGFRQD